MLGDLNAGAFALWLEKVRISSDSHNNITMKCKVVIRSQQTVRVGENVCLNGDP